MERAREVASGFTVTDWNAPWVARVCRRLDGIPLALELAAARVRALGPQDLADRLDDRFRLLRGNRAALPRQQTLQALIDWSYDLLSGQERQLLHRLAVFTGGWTLEAAEQVCSDPEDAAAGDLPLVEEWEVLDLLTALVDKSLVAAETHGGESRYRMLESIREYGLERLRASGEERALREVHFRYFTALVERDSMEGPRAAAVLARLDQERSNVRAALEFGLSETEHLQRALDIGGRLQRFWETRGNFGEGRDWLARATGHPAAAPRTAARAEALRALGTLSGSLGDYAAAVPALEESVSIARELGHGPLAVRALSNLGVILYARGDYPGARDLFEQALEVVRSYGDPSDTAMIVGNLGVLYREQGDLDTAWRLFKENVDLLRRLSRPGNLANALSNLGAVAQDRQDLSAARALHEESLGIRREIGDLTGISISLINLGLLTKDQGDYDASAGFVREALEVLERLEERRLTAYALEGAAALAAARGDFQRAGRIWGSAEALREAIGSPLPPNEVDEYARRMAEGQAALGEDGFEAARAQGRALSLDRAIAYARAVERPEP